MNLLGELILSKESLIRRLGFYVQLSWLLPLPTLDKRWFHQFEPLVRYEESRILDGDRVHPGGVALRSPSLGQAVSWDYKAWTAACMFAVYRNLLKLRLEYYVIEENNGVPGLGIDNVHFRNNEFLAQLELRF
jgi:hypothetical protein